MTKLGLFLIVFMIVPASVSAASVSQRTEGSCSPAVADVKGSVNITCDGVDPALMDEIVKLLNQILKSTQTFEQTRQELQRTTKRTDQIEARQAPRRLTSLQRSQLISLLSGKPAVRVQLVAVASDAEAMQYAKDFGAALIEAGWKAQGVQQLILQGDVPTGVQLWIKSQNDTQGAQILAESLQKVGIHTRVWENDLRSPATIELVVGVKPVQ